MRRKRVVEPDPKQHPQVLSVPLDSRELHVLAEKDFGRFGDYGEAEGSVVWFQPPAGSTDEEVALERARLLKCGAARVKPLPRAAGDQPVPAAALRVEAGPALGLRELVGAMLDEVEASVREPARFIVEGALAKAGI